MKTSRRKDVFGASIVHRLESMSMKPIKSNGFSHFILFISNMLSNIIAIITTTVKYTINGLRLPNEDEHDSDNHLV